MLSFRKYQGTGNDFVVIDNRNLAIQRNDVTLFKTLCDRHFGIGADGVMLLQNHPDADFEMVYANADGKESTMCGNGGRCIVKFAASLGLIDTEAEFIAIDGRHKAVVEGDLVKLQMIDVQQVNRFDESFEMNTGSPHYVTFLQGVAQLNIQEQGAAVRYNDKYRKEGINVNFAELQPDGLYLRTYERGVEAETLSCGTGVTAAALAHARLLQKEPGTYLVQVQTPGGKLKVTYTLHPSGAFGDIWLEGPALEVFSGSVNSSLLTGTY